MSRVETNTSKGESGISLNLVHFASIIKSLVPAQKNHKRPPKKTTKIFRDQIRQTMPMGFEVKIFESAKEFKEFVDKCLTEVNTSFIDHMKEADAARKRYEMGQKRVQAFKSMTGGKAQQAIQPPKQIEVEGFKVLVNPTPDYELTLFEEAINSLEEKKAAFERTKAFSLKIKEDTVKIGIILDDGMPTAFMYYMSDYQG